MSLLMVINITYKSKKWYDHMLLAASYLLYLSSYYDC